MTLGGDSIIIGFQWHLIVSLFFVAFCKRMDCYTGSIRMWLYDECRRSIHMYNNEMSKYQRVTLFSACVPSRKSLTTPSVLLKL